MLKIGPLTIRQKLIGTFLFIALLVAVTGGLSIFYFSKIDSAYTGLLQRNNHLLEHLGRLQAHTQLQNSLLFRYLVEPTKDNEQQLWNANAALSDQITAIAKQADSAQDDTQLAKLRESNETFRRLVTKVKDYVDRNELKLANTEAMLWSVPLTESLTQTAIALEEQQKILLQQQIAHHREIVETTSATFVWISITAVIVAIGIGLLLSRMIIGPIRTVSKSAQSIALGQLHIPDIPVRRLDEIGQLSAAFNQMKANLRMTVSQVGAHSDLVSTAAYQMSVHSNEISHSLEQVTSIVQLISEGSGHQVSGVDEASLLLYHMAASAEQVSAAALASEASSLDAKQAAVQGNQAIRSAIQQMHCIHRKIGELAEAVQRLAGRSADIHRANEVITEIARKTNLLALNASIEAARAGDAGKGFAVVAGEVRKLSMQSTVAAKEISELISFIRAETDEVSRSTLTGAEEVAAGVTMVEQAGDAFEQIEHSTAAAAEQSTDAVRKAGLVSEQAQAAVETIHHIKEVAHQSAKGTHEVCANIEEQYASMEEITASAERLSAMTAELHTLLSRFEV
jgi:methyl-accepting chemotaxis protein